MLRRIARITSASFTLVVASRRREAAIARGSALKHFIGIQLFATSTRWSLICVGCCTFAAPSRAVRTLSNCEWSFQCRCSVERALRSGDPPAKDASSSGAKPMTEATRQGSCRRACRSLFVPAVFADCGANDATQRRVSSPERTRASSTCICRLCVLPELLVTRFQSDVGVWPGSLAAIARPAKACSQFAVRSQYSPLGTPAISPVPQRVKKVVLGQPFS